MWKSLKTFRLTVIWPAFFDQSGDAWNDVPAAELSAGGVRFGIHAGGPDAAAGVGPECGLRSDQRSSA